jgi:octaprenyl-diphosphate synthase
MSQVTKNRAATPPELQEPYEIIREELEQAEKILREELHSDHPFVDRLAEHGFRLGGKRLRPALVLLSGKASGTLAPEHPILAAAVEMVHTATLVHDDVLDEAAIRRHLDTVNARWDNEASVLLGDYLFSQSICLVSSLDSVFACRAIGHAAKTMCEGELRQIQTRGNYDLTEDQYLGIIADKTAALCSCCCTLGAHYGGAHPSLIEPLARFGHDLGVAFQIIDDVLDILGDEATTGKSLGTDLIKQKATLPVIRLLNRSNAEQKAEIVSILCRDGDHHRDALRPWLKESDAISYAKQKAAQFIQSALDQLEHVPQGPARDSLVQVAGFVTARQH